MRKTEVRDRHHHRSRELLISITIHISACSPALRAGSRSQYRLRRQPMLVTLTSSTRDSGSTRSTSSSKSDSSKITIKKSDIKKSDIGENDNSKSDSSNSDIGNHDNSTSDNKKSDTTTNTPTPAPRRMLTSTGDYCTFSRLKTHIHRSRLIYTNSFWQQSISFAMPESCTARWNEPLAGWLRG